LSLPHTPEQRPLGRQLEPASTEVQSESLPQLPLVSVKVLHELFEVQTSWLQKLLGYVLQLLFVTHVAADWLFPGGAPTLATCWPNQISCRH
jgi:hypothetical protein